MPSFKRPRLMSASRYKERAAQRCVAAACLRDARARARAARKDCRHRYALRAVPPSVTPLLRCWLVRQQAAQWNRPAAGIDAFHFRFHAEVFKDSSTFSPASRHFLSLRPAATGQMMISHAFHFTIFK